MTERDFTEVAKPGQEKHYHTPAKWENGLKGPKHLEYPLADEYSLNEKIQLDQVTVSDITRELMWRTAPALSPSRHEKRGLES